MSAEAQNGDAGRAASDAASASTLSELLGISKVMIVQTDLGSLLNVIMEHAARVTGAERATLYIYNHTTGELASYIAQGAEVAQIRLPLAGGIAGHVAKTGKPVNLEDAYRSPLFDPSWDERTGYRTRSVLTVPMRLPEGRLAGVLQVLNKRRGLFTEEDEATLLMFSSHAAVAIDNARLHEDLKLVFKSAIGALAEAVDQRDPVTAGHSERVTYYAVRIGRSLGMSSPDLDALECAAMLHDIGKIAVPDSVLTKADRLTDEEYRVVKRHASSTRDILDQFHFSGQDAAIPATAGDHHERLDGSGYPRGLKADQLSLAARILAIADVYDAVTSFDRTYRRAMSPLDAIALLRSEAGTKLDGEVIEAFARNELYNIERRRYVRIDGSFEIEYRILPRDRCAVEATMGRGTTRDICGCGLRFVAEDFIPVGFLLEVTVHLASGEFHLLARTVRVEQVGHTRSYEIAITFLNLSGSAQRALQQYLVDVSRP